MVMDHGACSDAPCPIPLTGVQAIRPARSTPNFAAAIFYDLCGRTTGLHPCADEYGIGDLRLKTAVALVQSWTTTSRTLVLSMRALPRRRRNTDSNPSPGLTALLCRQPAKVLREPSVNKQIHLIPLAALANCT